MRLTLMHGSIQIKWFNYLLMRSNIELHETHEQEIDYYDRD